MTTTTPIAERYPLNFEITCLRREALDAARQIEDDTKRAGALLTVAYLAQPSHRGPLFTEAIATADAIVDRRRRAVMLASIFVARFAKGAWGESAETLLDRILQSLDDLEQSDRVKVLTRVIPVLPMARRLTALDRATEEIRKVADPAVRVNQFAVLMDSVARPEPR